MMGRLAAVGFVVPVLVWAVSESGVASGEPGQPPSAADRVYREALHAIGLTPTDLTIRGDYQIDPDRLEITRRLLERPLSAADLVRDISEALGEPSSGAALALAGRCLDVDTDDAFAGVVSARETASLPGVGEHLAGLLAPLLAELAACRSIVDEVRGAFTPEDRRRIGGLMALVDPGESLRETSADSLLEMGRRVRLGKLTAAAGRALAAVDRFVGVVAALPAGALDLTGGPLRTLTAAGPVVIGGTEDNVYTRPAALIVDLGGNDRYEAGAGVSSHVLPVSICIDLKGSDDYASAQGCGVLGLGIVVDVEGDDRYEGGPGAQGCGVAGVGILEDQQGNDRYRAGFAGQGFGLYGIGVLCDRGGDDSYRGDLLVQGAAGPGGAGTLCDGAGDDAYDAGGRYPDFREDGTHFRSMAQGFALGRRPVASGGMGILWDGGGRDLYRADYFGQGASHWAGTGILIDRAGDDAYEARRYAQGSGSHLAAGLLADDAGNDRYTLWGVGQGCGHDLAVGMLLDRSGDDAYRASWLAQGAGEANGFGVLEDTGGDDAYVAEGHDVQGYGGPSRGYGSIGLLIDRGGRDRYGGFKWGGNRTRCSPSSPLEQRCISY